jgi:hypothetical protein
MQTAKANCQAQKNQNLPEEGTMNTVTYSLFSFFSNFVSGPVLLVQSQTRSAALEFD